MRIQAIVPLVVFFHILSNQTHKTLSQTDVQVDELKDSLKPLNNEEEGPKEEAVEKLPVWFDDIKSEITKMDILRFCLCILLLLFIVAMIYHRARKLRIYYQLMEDLQIDRNYINRNNLLDNVDPSILNMIDHIGFNGENFENAVRMYRRACQNRLRMGTRQSHRSHG